MSIGVGTVALWIVLARLALGPADPDAVEVPIPRASPAADAVVLSWEAPEVCPDEAALRRELSGWLGEGPTAEAGAAVFVVAKIREVEEGLQLSLRTETASGVTTKEASAADCVVLMETTAVIVAFAVDPSGVLRRAEAPRLVAETEAELAEPESEVGTEAELEPTTSAETVGVQPPIDHDTPEQTDSMLPIRFGMRASGGVDIGMLPALAGGFQLTGAVLGRSWRAELRGDVWLPRTAIAEEGIGGRISMVSGGARGCGVPRVVRLGLEFPLCGGLEAGTMRGDPVGTRVASPETSRVPWLAANASAGLAWVPRRFLAVVVQAELVVPILRAGFRVGEIEVHRAAAVGGRAVLGLEARFP